MKGRGAGEVTANMKIYISMSQDYGRNEAPRWIRLKWALLGICIGIDSDYLY